MSHRLKILKQINKENNNLLQQIKNKPGFTNLYLKVSTPVIKFNYKKYFEIYNEKIKSLLNLRKQMNIKKPSFKRYKSATIKRISESWRHPRGLQSKARIQKKGTPKHPKIGYSKPKLVRNLNEKGCKEIVIYNLTQLNQIIDKKEKIMIVLSKKLGMKKKLNLEMICEKNNLFVKNSIKINKYIS